ncbi:DUF2510 domain-containing protein [Salinibacterium sp. dk2585]|uniref:DUF2510 domain-containing protein n=1 Tax=unclassified Salinibacterium TaxID=2632331 RepID=UPI0011C24C65|nr:MULTISPECIES: DUF2510 domain-containing protein [unclassified Salinibacterium]QEE62095.1 DUF2510 domain-containing protein [Salinibacterium sp. dk2585]TXK53447.1 DUF2510 domain-containing protein [Salinibacterium sp. dk5596]
MTDSLNNATPAGWYVDPMTHQHLRWWNGQAWTESVAPLPGAPAAQPVAPAPRVQQRFAIGAADESTQAAAAQTQTAAERFAPSSVPAQEQHSEEQGFKTQVPAYAARIEQPRTEAQANAQPAIPWPAMGNATTQAAGHYTPQYGDALDLLKGTSLVSGSGGPDAAPAYRRSSTAPLDTGTDAPADAFAQPQRLDPPHGEVRPDLAFATRQQQEEAARAAEKAHLAELARQEEARLEWDRQFQAQQAQAEELRLAQLAQVQAQLNQAQQQAQAQQAPQQASEPDTELESTLMSRRQRREKPEPVPPAPAAEPRDHDDRHDDVWAGPEDRRAEVKPQWSTVGSARAAERQYAAPRFWGTVSVWLLTITPWLGALAAFVALALFDAWSLPALGVLALPWLIGVLWAQQDATRLGDFGHERPARAAWAMLTAPVYLVMRTIRVRQEVGTGTAPLWVWALNAAAVIAIVASVGLAPDALPAYLVTALEPLRETAGDWLGR